MVSARLGIFAGLHRGRDHVPARRTNPGVAPSPAPIPTRPLKLHRPAYFVTQYFTAAYHGSVQSSRRLRRHQVYPGVDVVFYGTGENLEYDFEIAAGANPSRIQMNFDGANRLRMALNGDLMVDLGGRTGLPSTFLWFIR